MLVRVQKYVRGVLEGVEFGAQGEIGRELLGTLGLAPRVDAVELERMFNSHLQDVWMVVYFSNLVRSQFDVANRLALVVS
jgi:translation initiation factor 3 subunit F